MVLAELHDRSTPIPYFSSPWDGFPALKCISPVSNDCSFCRNHVTHTFERKENRSESMVWLWFMQRGLLGKLLWAFISREQRYMWVERAGGPSFTVWKQWTSSNCESAKDLALLISDYTGLQRSWYLHMILLWFFSIQSKLQMKPLHLDQRRRDYKIKRKRICTFSALKLTYLSHFLPGFKK